MEVYYGSKVFDGNGGQTAKVEAIYEHYDFVRGNLVNDIALIKLKNPVRFDDTTSPVCLPERGEMVPDGTSAYVAGWVRRIIRKLQKHICKNSR